MKSKTPQPETAETGKPVGVALQQPCSGVLLEQWAVVIPNEPYLPPEILPRMLTGIRPDEKRVRTSEIAGSDGEAVITASGSRYLIGAPDPEFIRRHPDAREVLLRQNDPSVAQSHD